MPLNTITVNSTLCGSQQQLLRAWVNRETVDSGQLHRQIKKVSPAHKPKEQVYYQPVCKPPLEAFLFHGLLHAKADCYQYHNPNNATIQIVPNVNGKPS